MNAGPGPLESAGQQFPNGGSLGQGGAALQTPGPDTAQARMRTRSGGARWMLSNLRPGLTALRFSGARPLTRLGCPGICRTWLGWNPLEIQ